MLLEKEMKQLSLFLKEDIKILNLSGKEIPERASFYLENISGLESVSEKDFQKLIKQILSSSKFPSL